MKKLFSLIALIFLLVIPLRSELKGIVDAGLIDTAPGSDPRCLQIKVKFTASPSWREGADKRYIMVGCNGQQRVNNNPPGCTGGLAKLRPGEEVTLGRCSCFNREGCLKVGKELKIEKNAGEDNIRKVTVVKRLEDTASIKNGTCSYDLLKGGRKVRQPLCGTNSDRFNVRLNIACASQPTETPTPTPTPTPSASPTPTTSPTPSICPVPDQPLNVRVTCPNCFSEDDLNDPAIPRQEVEE